jgi:gamma-glutamylcysteine synthetase
MEFTNKWNYEEINRFKTDIAKIGLNAKIENQTGWDIAKKLLDASSKGLSSRSKTNSYGDDETIHLDYLFQIVDSQESQATKLIKSYMNDQNLDIEKLYNTESF